MRLSPFRALRYDPAVAGPPRETSAPPYDGLDGMRYLGHRTTNPYTVLQLMAEERAGHDGRPVREEVDFATAGATLERWRRTGVLVEDPLPAMFLYEIHDRRPAASKVQRGVVAAVDLTDVDDGALLLHEHVDARRARVRAARIEQVPVDLTPVMALHVRATPPPAAQVIGAATRRDPVSAFSDELGLEHRLWRITDPQQVDTLTRAYADVTGVLADGHHRIAAARMVRDRHVRRGRPLTGWGRTTVWIMDARQNGPDLHAVHRLVHGRPSSGSDGCPAVEGFRSWQWTGSAEALERAVTALPGPALGLVTTDGAWILQAADPETTRSRLTDTPPPLADLDAVVAYRCVVPHLSPPGPVEGVVDITTGTQRLQGHPDATLLVLRPPTARQVFDVAAAGMRMPAKTTWFKPKPRAGVVMRALDGSAVGSARR